MTIPLTREEFDAEMVASERRRNEQWSAINADADAARASMAKAWSLLRSITEHSVLRHGVTADLLRELDAQRGGPSAHRR